MKKSNTAVSEVMMSLPNSATTRETKPTKEQYKIFGKHLVIDAYGIEESKLKDRQSIKELLNFLPGYMGMRQLTVATLRKVQSPSYPNWGLSGFIMLYESHISCHTWPEEGYVSMDVYSCRDFDEKKTVQYLKEYWGAKRIITQVIPRG